jgi:hypothetical protein
LISWYTFQLEWWYTFELLFITTAVDGINEHYSISYNLSCSYLFGDQESHLITVKWKRIKEGSNYSCQEVLLDGKSMGVKEINNVPVAHLIIDR